MQVRAPVRTVCPLKTRKGGNVYDTYFRDLYIHCTNTNNVSYKRKLAALLSQG